MKAQHINTFLEALYRVLQNLTELDGKKKKVIRIDHTYNFSGIVTGFKTTGKVQGEVYFIMQKNVALEIATRAFFGLTFKSFDGIAKDAIYELGCRIAADSVKEFNDTAVFCKISSPFVSFTGGSFDFTGKQTLGIEIHTECGEVFLIASFKS